MWIFTKVKQHVFQRDGLDEPNKQLTNEIVQSTAMIDLAEQLNMTRIAKIHMKQFVLPGVQLDPAWTSGYALQNEIFVSYGEETVYRCNLEVFFQDNGGQRKSSYLVSLVRFEGDYWRVLQVKSNTYLEEKRDLNDEA